MGRKTPADALQAEVAEHEPDLQGPETSTELGRVLVEVADWHRLVERTEVLRHEAEGGTQGVHVPGQASEQSMGVKSHLCGLTTIESARSQPANGARRSGSNATTPA